MSKRTKYKVDTTNGDIARFSNYNQAMWFARSISLHLPQFHIEVSALDGLVGQFKNGVATPEFEDRKYDGVEFVQTERSMS